jgi:nicotinate-nucleotide pyrophosphorylase (carboxylating)
MTLKEYYKKYKHEIDRLISSALREDKVSDDVTTNLLLKGEKGNKRVSAVLLCKQDCVLAGLDIFERVFKKLDPKTKFSGKFKDGSGLRNKDKVLRVESSLKTLLAGERTALNFIQRMSGIATLTDKFVKKLKYPGSKILHTRKATPNFRVFEIAAVKTGGGDFHRHDLSSAVMIKDNHIEASGSIKKILELLRDSGVPAGKKDRFEIEVKSFKELEEVVNYGKQLVKIVMLDNFRPAGIKQSIEILKKNGFKIEVSGGINLENFAKIQQMGINYYSVGALTHSYKSVDFSLEF